MNKSIAIFLSLMFSTLASAATIRSDCLEIYGGQSRKLKSISMSTYANGKAFINLNLEGSDKKYILGLDSGAEALALISLLRSDPNDKVIVTLGMEGSDYASK